MNNACWVGEAVCGREHGSGRPRRSQQVGNRRGCDQGTRGGVGQQRGLGVRVSANVGMGACGVAGAAVGQGKCMPMYGRRNKGLRSAVRKVAIPLLVTRAKMLNLPKANRLLLLGLECRSYFLRPVEKRRRVVMLSPWNASSFGLG